METYQKKITLDPHPDDTRLSVIMDGARIGSVHRCGPRFLGRLLSGRIVANCGSEAAAAQAVTDFAPSQEKATRERKDDIKDLVSEAERRWRSRTPGRSVLDGLASFRVTSSEIRQWGQERGIKVDETDLEYRASMVEMYERLQTEFPEERWSR